MDRMFYGLLGLWAGLTGIFLVTNLEVEWSKPILGFAALALGVVCVIRASR